MPYSGLCSAGAIVETLYHHHHIQQQDHQEADKDQCILDLNHSGEQPSCGAIGSQSPRECTDITSRLEPIYLNNLSQLAGYREREGGQLGERGQRSLLAKR